MKNDKWADALNEISDEYLEEAAELAKAVKGAEKYVNFGLCVRAWPEYDYLKTEYQNDEYMHLTAAAYAVILENLRLFAEELHY